MAVNTKISPKPTAVDPVWQAVRKEAEAVVAKEPLMSSFIFNSILNRDSLESAVIFRISERLHNRDFSGDLVRQSFQAMHEDWPEWSESLRIDIAAVYDRDPACSRLIEPILYFKGFHAIQTHRLAHWNYTNGNKDIAFYLQSRSSQVFQVDIHPAAKFGKGIFFDHSTGIVVGETAALGNDVSVLHGVTLGGTGKEMEDRHPKIGDGVLLGAGATVLGNISVGSCSRIAAGSMVIKDVPKNVTVAGIPGRVVGVAGCSEPSRSMNQIIAEDKK